MKFSIIIGLTLSLIGCSAPNPVRMEAGHVYVVTNNGKKSFSFGTPPGEWYLNSSARNTMSQGFVNIKGKHAYMPAGYAIRFSMDSGVRESFLSPLVEVLKTGNYEKYLDNVLKAYTPERLLEQQKSNLGGKLIVFNGMRCRNYWVDGHVGPGINSKRYGGQGIVVYSNYISCPLVVDGEPYRLGINVDSSISDQVFLYVEEYNKNKNPEDPSIELDFDTYAENLGETFIDLFGSFKVHGKVSQNYEDVAIKCHPTLGDDC